MDREASTNQSHEKDCSVPRPEQPLTPGSPSMDFEAPPSPSCLMKEARGEKEEEEVEDEENYDDYDDYLDDDDDDDYLELLGLTKEKHLEPSDNHHPKLDQNQELETGPSSQVSSPKERLSERHVSTLTTTRRKSMLCWITLDEVATRALENKARVRNCSAAADYRGSIRQEKNRCRLAAASLLLSLNKHLHWAGGSKHGSRSINEPFARERLVRTTSRTTTYTRGSKHGFPSITIAIVSSERGKRRERRRRRSRRRRK
ncbi:uncharacterized protein LOC143210305 isoform X3 [Lasioglossum baleicum]|uniref:uncharacterized protein LOC143210305 isoform X3 n=1 Tax=Lasioglossum baleicum TaxID=434251 RepID=UPI003FCE2FE7